MAIDKNELERYRAEQELYERAISGDVDAQIEWLTSRRPDKWKHTPAEDPNEYDD